MKLDITHIPRIRDSISVTIPPEQIKLNFKNLKRVIYISSVANRRKGYG